MFGRKRKKKVEKTRICIEYDAGFPNTLYIRGTGAGLSWDKGMPLKNEGSNEWIFETNLPFDQCEFKILLNDKQYEVGENHSTFSGTEMKITPRF